MKAALAHPGIVAALTAALLFGASTPVAKMLLVNLDPWLLAGLLYLGSGLGLGIYRVVRRTGGASLPKQDWFWLLVAVCCGGVLSPVLMLYGLINMPASGASLLLNAEGVFTALLAWVVFGENVDRRIALGMVAIVGGAVVLSWPRETHFGSLWPSLAVLGACLGWGLDNNVTRKIALNDATWLAMVKGLVAGTVNLGLALTQEPAAAHWSGVLSALILGFAAYGVSLVLFVVALRHLGTARTGAYFALAPFVGAALALAMGEPLTVRLVVAGVLMGIGVWLHLTEHHSHEHTHDAMEHAHEHSHDEHHQHEHDPPVPPGTKHSHPHRHQPITHNHAHYPDAHHRHTH